MIKIAVVDDMKIVTLDIKLMLERYDFDTNISVDAYISGKELLENAQKIKYDILITDIELSEEHQKVEENGMYLASKIKTMYPDTTIIYITGTICYKADLLFHEPFRYIQKPIKEDDICKAVEDAIYRIENTENKLLGIQAGGGDIMLKLSEITYFASDKRKITAHMEKEDVSFYEKMNYLEKRIGELSDHFVRPGKSYLVNLQRVRKVSGEEIELYDSTIIPISRRYKKDVAAKCEKFIQSFTGRK